MDGPLTGSPLGDDDGEDASPDGNQRHGNEEGGGNGSDNVGPDTAAVHDALEEAEPGLEEGAVVVAENNLEVALQGRTEESAQVNHSWMRYAKPLISTAQQMGGRKNV